MNKKLIQAIGVGVSATTLSAFAGDMAVTPPAPVNNGNWCNALQDVGTLYKNKSNPYIQEIKFFGRAHYQFSYTDGENNGQDFHSDGGELRRLRFGTSVKFLNGFKLLGRVDLEDGDYRDDKLGYAGFDELYLSYSAGDLGAFEDVTFTYGRVKVLQGGEEHMSSKKIKTIERSNLNNTFAPNRATGFSASAKLGNVNYSAAIFSTDDDREALGDWNEGLAYYASAQFDGLGGEITADFIYSDTSAGEENAIGSDWAASLTHQSTMGNWDLFLNATYGKTDNNDAVYGVVVMPSTFLIEDKLEAVVRYQYAASDAVDGFSINDRNVRNAAGAHRLNTQIASGDENHTLYAGLNYYLCDHNAKVMVGVEYETLDGGTAADPVGGTAADPVDLEATTLWAAFRMYF
ncbi:OprO/OprP family phosphate-selective porin [Akkermansiaceae bacterium]|nr:OprO/OprP family phosphate-selective porin [Akkermansiaceae bacterium]